MVSKRNLDYLVLVERVGKSKYLFLLIAMVSLIAIFPFFEGSGFDRFAFKIFSMLILFSGLVAVSKSNRVLLIGLVLAGISIVSTWNYLLYELPGDRITDLVSVSAFSIFITVVILGDVLKGDEVTTDSIYGGICVYLLMGYAWALIYELVEIFHPGSINAPGASTGDPINNLDFFFFSFVTLTTLGYGDITPVSTFARSLAILEAMAGTLFIAIFIARLVGLTHKNR